ncbi:MAG: hypothetical protein JWQ89_39 [Devosia sp.]|uniref:SH3 domain-containing protein n=1 Tax=Devosia sp. TaxID=1871048 RepID=UPI00262FBAC6|nr:hypothetical protein [Devosia sp.]MDB5538312.1 hypothetical protein [Devosia sp.]
MFARTLKTAALATLVVAATAGASFAAQYAWVDNDAKVKQFHKQASPTVNWVSEGDKVKIIGSWGNWYKLQIPGQDGWVKANVLDFTPGPGPFPGYGYGYGGSFCINGDNASFCLSGGY